MSGKSTRSPLLILMVALMVGRITGLVREMLLGNLLGASREADLVIIALSVPDALVNFFLVSGFNAVLVPYLLTQRSQDRSEQFWSLSVPIVLTSIFVALITSIFTVEVIQIFGPGLQPFSEAEIDGFRWVLLSLPFAIGSGLFVAWLVSQDSFLFGGLGTAVINSAVIAGLLVGYLLDDVFFWSIVALLVGMIARFFMQWAGCQNRQLQVTRFKFTRDFNLLRQVTIAAASMSALTLAPLLFRSIVSYVGEGNVTLFSLSLKVIEVPLTIVFWSLGIVSLPKLSALYSESADAATNHLKRGIVSAVWFGGACFTLTAGFSKTWITLLYGWGTFPDQHLDVMAQSISLGAIAFPVMGVTTLLLNDFFARRRYAQVFLYVFCSISLAGLSAWYVIDRFDVSRVFLVLGGLYAIIGFWLILSRSRSALPRLGLSRFGLSVIGLYPLLVWLVLNGILEGYFGPAVTYSMYLITATALALLGFQAINRTASIR